MSSRPPPAAPVSHDSVLPDLLREKQLNPANLPPALWVFAGALVKSTRRTPRASPRARWTASVNRDLKPRGDWIGGGTGRATLKTEMESETLSSSLATGVV